MKIQLLIQLHNDGTGINQLPVKDMGNLRKTKNIGLHIDMYSLK